MTKLQRHAEVSGHGIDIDCTFDPSANSAWVSMAATWWCLS
jgi:hypothetical protein